METLFPFPQHIVFLPCAFAKNGTSEDIRKEQSLLPRKPSSVPPILATHSPAHKHGRPAPLLLCRWTKADSQRCGELLQAVTATL